MNLIKLDVYKEYFKSKASLSFWSSVSEGCSAELTSTKISSPYLLLTDMNYWYQKFAHKVSAKSTPPSSLSLRKATASTNLFL